MVWFKKKKKVKDGVLKFQISMREKSNSLEVLLDEFLIAQTEVFMFGGGGGAAGL